VEESNLEPRNQPAASLGPDIVEQRRKPRFKIEVEITVRSRTCGTQKGHTADISESGISALLKIEVPLDEVVELEFTLPSGPVAIYAMVRQQNAFRYGFHFVELNPAHEVIRVTCRHLAIEQTPFGEAAAVRKDDARKTMGERYSGRE
jgi:hypothetical protein